MVDKDRWDKKFNLYAENKSWINKMLDERDKNLYPYEGDYVLFIFHNFYNKLEVGSLRPDEVITPEQQKLNEILKEICNWGFLNIIGNTFVCLRDIRSKGKPYWLLDENKKPLSIDGVIKHCDGCKRGEQFDKDLTSVRTMFIEVAKEQGNERYPYEMFLCNHPDVKSWRFTFFKMGNLKCPLKEDKEVMVNTVCRKCEYLSNPTIYIPLIESPKYKEYIKRLEDLR